MLQEIMGLTFFQNTTIYMEYQSNLMNCKFYGMPIRYISE